MFVEKFEMKTDDCSRCSSEVPFYVRLYEHESLVSMSIYIHVNVNANYNDEINANRVVNLANLPVIRHMIYR